MRLKILILLILTIIIVISLSIYTPKDKRQLEIWRVECELGVVTDPDCPVDGGWSPWGVWSACRGSCDQVGHRVRTRECTNPPPSPGGKLCSGPQEQTENCHITNCSISNFRLLVEGDRSRSEALRQLEAVPALMERCLHMDCPFEAIEEALAVDNTWQLNAESIWNSLQCVKHNMGCPVIGEWGAWGKWSACSARCGQGLKWRCRRCNAPSPSEARYVCSGTPLDANPCEGDQCAIEQRGASGTWAEWGEWSACSESCGAGIKRRRRNCVETQTPLISGVWGTHCRGQHDEIQQCNNEQCTLNGGWSGWGPWGPCSQTCGAGRRTRSRSCTRPIPAGSGRACAGPKTEVGSCYLIPCKVNTHTVALFNGDSYLQYRFDKKKNIMFHFYVRFMPLSPHGTLVRRGPTYTPYVQLILHKWHICLDAAGLDRSCSLPRICSHNTVKPAVWHSVMVTVTTESAALRLDDAPIALKNVFPCDPDLPKNEIDLIVGSKFYGEIQEIIINFVPLQITLEKGQRSLKSDRFPVLAKNVAYEMGSLEEGYVYIHNNYFMRLPCFSEGEQWQLELTVKPKRESGTILFMGNVHEWLHVTLQNSRLKLKLVYGGYRSESVSATECPNDQWLDVTIKKTQLVNSIEAIVNGRERLHVQVESEMERKRREFQKLFRNTNLFTAPDSNSPIKLCRDEYFVGGVPPNLMIPIGEEFTPFQGYIATIRLNAALYDLHDIGLERYKNNLLQISSRTASVSEYYQEISWGKSNSLNLSCLHARMARSSSDSHWLYLDSEIFEPRAKMDRIRDDGRVLRLISTPVNDIRGFYTCRAYTDKYTRNILTFAVLGKATYNSSDPYLPTLIAVLSSLFLIITCLGWLFGEGINDIRKGHGFFRDRHMTQGQVVKAICEYIDANQDLIGGSEAARMSRLIARRRAFKALCGATYAAQGSRGIMQQPRGVNENIPRQVDLPALLENSSVPADPSHDIVPFEPNNVSTPQHGSLSSPKRKLTSSSSVGVVSPRVLCSRIAVAKNRISPRGSVASRKSITRRNRSNWANKAAQTILHKFQQLQNNV